jgi:predicted dehydrogenase
MATGEHMKQQSNARSTSRRRFLKHAAVAAAGPMIVRASVLGAAAGTGTPPPSERITLGLIGPGKQGSSHLGALVLRSDVQILAICDVQEERRKAARELIEKRTGTGPSKDKETAKNLVADAEASTANNPWAVTDASAIRGTGPATSANDVSYYNDFRELLGRKDIDAVLIAVPDHWHATVATHALKAGKDVYLEKPLTLTIREAKELIDTTRRYARILQTGSQQRSSREFRIACEMVRNGRIGELKRVWVVIGVPSKECDLPGEPVRAGVDWDMWLGPAPWRPFSKTLCPPVDDPGWALWRSYRDYSGGAMTDFGAHHFDIAQWAMGMDESGPVEILPPEPKGRKYLTYRYASGVEMIHASTGNAFGGAGLTFEGSEGKIRVDRGVLELTPASLVRYRPRPGEVQLYKSPGHHQDWINGIRQRKHPNCHVEIGARSVTVCHLGNICYWLNRALKWDPVNWQFVGDEEANRWLDRPKRGNWMV